MANGDGGGLERSFAARLGFQFRHNHPAGRGPYTHEEAARIIRENGWGQVSPTYLWELRAGKKKTPSFEVVRALCRLFDLPLDYWTDEQIALRKDTELRLTGAFRDAGVQAVALRTAGLSQRGLDRVLGFVEAQRQSEGLPDEEPDG